MTEDYTKSRAAAVQVPVLVALIGAGASVAAAFLGNAGKFAPVLPGDPTKTVTMTVTSTVTASSGSSGASSSSPGGGGSSGAAAGPDFVRRLTVPGPRPLNPNAINLAQGAVVVGSPRGALVYDDSAGPYELRPNLTEPANGASVLGPADATPTSGDDCAQHVRTAPVTAIKVLTKGLRICATGDGGIALLQITQEPNGTSGALSLTETFWRSVS